MVPTLRHRLKLAHTLGSAEEEVEALDTFIRELALAAAPDLAVRDHEGGQYSATGYAGRFAPVLQAAENTVRI